MLSAKTALVTGSTSGIGLGIAIALAQHGARVMLNGFGDVEGALAQVRRFDPKTLHDGADMSRPEQIEAMIRRCEAELGGCDILVNNAGIQHVAPIPEFPVERWDAILAINLSSAFHAMRAALPGMQRRNWGRIVNVASVHGLVASTNKSAYVAAKHGIVGLTKVAICPGWVLTPLVQKQVDARAAAEHVDNDQAKRELLAEKQPSLQFTTPEQLAALVVFLCSPGADNIRGAAINVDGGWIAQ
jgi:3-hydroxybutyrate dehydrogenase